MYRILLIATSILILSGCASRESILVPGQIESDCEDRASQLGVCASPKTAYEHKDKIGKIYYEDGQAYYVKKNGRVYNVDTNEEVIPGKKPEGCGESICVNCDDEDSKPLSEISSVGGKKGVKPKSRSLVIKTKQETTAIRDLGWEQKIWIAPYVNKGDDLVEAHSIHVVIKKPSWIIGEKQPRHVKRSVVVPSLVAKETLRDNHSAIPRTNNEVILNYISEQNLKEKAKYKKIQEFINKQKERSNK